MKNFDLLPLNDIQMERVKKFAEMHQRFGGIIIDVIAYDKALNAALIRIVDRKSKLSPEQLAAKANEVFKDEAPEELQLFYTTMQEESKFYLTWDKKFVVRVHDYFFVWQIKPVSYDEFYVEPYVPILYVDKLIVNDRTETEKARKWLKNYLIIHKETI